MTRGQLVVRDATARRRSRPAVDLARLRRRARPLVSPTGHPRDQIAPVDRAAARRSRPSGCWSRSSTTRRSASRTCAAPRCRRSTTRTPCTSATCTCSSDHRRRGVGKQLLEAAADWADEQDSRTSSPRSPRPPATRTASSPASASARSPSSRASTVAHLRCQAPGDGGQVVGDQRDRCPRLMRRSREPSWTAPVSGRRRLSSRTPRPLRHQVQVIRAVQTRRSCSSVITIS